MSTRGALLTNLLGLSPLAVAAIVHSSDPDLYYRMVQEDGVLEWATFWALIAAAALFLAAAIRERRKHRTLPWFLAGVGLFCLFVAGEEISWGQRILGYRPPDYFLAENFQQELNLHNVWDTDLRKLLAKATLLVYGVFLPLAALPTAGRRGLERLGVVAPPLSVVPIFFAAFWVYETYPWSFSGEIIELVMAFGFLFASLTAWWRPTRQGPEPPRLGHLGLAFLVVLALAFGARALNGLSLADNSRLRELAKTELGAMADDLMRGTRPLSRCGIHKRVYSFVEKYEVDPLVWGRFSRLVDNGLPEKRASFFLDPWNSPYWIRHECEGGQSRAFVYSLGPDRRRQATEWELLGDDIGVVYYESGF